MNIANALHFKFCTKYLIQPANISVCGKKVTIHMCKRIRAQRICFQHIRCLHDISELVLTNLSSCQPAGRVHRARLPVVVFNIIILPFDNASVGIEFRLVDEHDVFPIKLNGVILHHSALR